MLTTHDIKIVKSTVPLLEAGGVAITRHFYQRLFKHHPELKNIFNMSNQHTDSQRIALFEAILAYAKNIDNLAVLKHAVERIAQKHTSFHIQPFHYQYVGDHLIETLRELLPEQFTPEVEAAWTKAYSALAQILIGREEELYTTKEESEGGWRGKRAFSLVEKRVESELVTSFIFEPLDRQPVMDYHVGQYIGIELTTEQFENTEIRQYSLSQKPNGTSYRISVKREPSTIDGNAAGMVSNYLHDYLAVGDMVDLHAPAGDFYFVDRQAPVVLISAGVGITPMQAMLEALAEKQYNQAVHFVHACERANQHSFADRTQSLCEAHKWQHHVWYRTEKLATPLSSTHHGLINFSQIELPIDNGDFYVCGPVAFMQYTKNALLALGVANERIHYEVFGPHATL
ncbi:NO-inducible flavohemoprotein [Flocculibacter collagenilyticus]|uniref:NO-inducible flavohemoprotein n=1 Tax=Flocculibacter collagenilyticus TaxID=2744479 RepID=UPI0018F6D7AC|nr:NO-inducible flavohemoprotein [Flocculibacter collagenilyticus]